METWGWIRIVSKLRDSPKSGGRILDVIRDLIWLGPIEPTPRLAGRCPRRPPQRVEIRPLLVATIQRLPQRTIESIFPTPGTVSPRVAFHTPFGPSNTAVPPLTSRMVHPSMVVGLVSGTGAGLVETFGRSTTVDCGALAACFVSDESMVCAPRFEVSCAVLVTVAMVFAGASRSGLGTSGRSSAEELTVLTGSDAGSSVKKSEFNAAIHPMQRANADSNAPRIIVVALRAGAPPIRSRLSILIFPSHANPASGAA